MIPEVFALVNNEELIPHPGNSFFSIRTFGPCQVHLVCPHSQPVTLIIHMHLKRTLREA